MDDSCISILELDLCEIWEDKHVNKQQNSLDWIYCIKSLYLKKQPYISEGDQATPQMKAEVSHLGTNWVRITRNGTNLGLILVQISVHFGSVSQNVLRSYLNMSRICPIWGESGPVWGQIWHSWMNKSRDMVWELSPLFVTSRDHWD